MSKQSAQSANRQRSSGRRRGVSKLALLFGGLFALVGLVVATAGFGSSSPFRQQTATTGDIAPYVAPTGSPIVQGDPNGQPLRVVVQTATGRTLVNAPLTPRVADDSGVLSSPSGQVGWYSLKPWPRPGFTGTAILNGHVSVKGKADVFINLDQARPGDKVVVTYNTGDQVSFTVTRGKVMKKADVSADASIWAPTSKGRSIRLITCDRVTETDDGAFPNNYVVWAEQTKPGKAGKPGSSATTKQPAAI